MHCRQAGTSRRRSKVQREREGEVRRRTSCRTGCSQNAALMLWSTSVHRRRSSAAVQRMLQHSEHIINTHGHTTLNTQRHDRSVSVNAVHKGHCKLHTVDRSFTHTHQTEACLSTNNTTRATTRHQRECRHHDLQLPSISGVDSKFGHCTSHDYARCVLFPWGFWLTLTFGTRNWHTGYSLSQFCLF